MVRSYTHHVAPQAGGTPADQPANINVIVPEPKRDFGWWLTTIGTVVVPVLALVLAIVSLVYQNEANQRANQTQCRLAYFRHAAMPVFVLVRIGLASLMVAGASCLVPCWPGFLTG